MKPHRIDRIVLNYRWIMLGGAVLTALATIFDCPGIIAGGMAVGLGASGGALHQWRTEPGLWRLSALFSVMFGFIGAMFLYAFLKELFRQGPAPPLGDSLDLSIAALLLWEQLRFLISVTLWNRRSRVIIRSDH